MIAYNPKAWFTFIFRFHKADTLRKLFTTIIGIAIYSGLIVFIEQEFLVIDKASKINNIGIVHSMLGFVISMLLVFRTNTAYERWWDGRKNPKTSRRNHLMIAQNAQRGLYERASPPRCTLWESKSTSRL